MPDDEGPRDARRDGDDAGRDASRDEQSHPGDRARRLGRYAEDARFRELRDEIEDLRAQLAGYDGPIQNITVKLDRLLTRQLSWPDIDADTRARRWPELLTWLHDVFGDRYPTDAAMIRPCWWRHPAAVDALTALWLTYCVAYRDPSAPLSEAATWQTRWRPDLVALAAEVTSGCDQHLHHPTVPVNLLVTVPEEAP